MTLLDPALQKISPDRVVDNRVYDDPEVFRLECERIFSKVWLFVGHESELTETGDYITTNLLGNPVLVTRDHEGAIRAYLNVCRHRGSTIVDEPRGHCAAFRCPYHFWSYSLEGELIGIPHEEAYDGTGFEKESFPLIGLDCDSVLGLVFVNLSKEHESLREYLGEDLIEVLSRPLANAEFEVCNRTESHDLPINWKVVSENGRDGYHVPFVHPFLRKSSPPGEFRILSNGHAVQELGADPRGFDPKDWEMVAQHPFPGLEVGEGYIVNLFPDVMIMCRWNMISIDFTRQSSPNQTTMENRTLGLKGDTPEVREIRQMNQRFWFANPIENEDTPVFLKQQEGVSAPLMPFSIIARGADSLTGTRGDDNRLRQFWVEWRKLMGVEQNSLSSFES